MELMKIHSTTLILELHKNGQDGNAYTTVILTDHLMHFASFDQFLCMIVTDHNQTQSNNNTYRIVRI